MSRGKVEAAKSAGLIERSLGGTLSLSVSKPAQPPLSLLEQASQVISEVMLLALSVLAGFALLFGLMAAGLLQEGDQGSILAGPILLGTAGAVYLFGEGRMEAKRRPLLSEGERKSVVSSVLVALGLTVAAILGSSMLGMLQEALSETEVEEQQTILDLVARGDSAEIAWLALSAVILAPLSEEFLFRHMFFRRLFHRMPVAAWTLPPVAFALAHGNLAGLAIYVWLGLVFAYGYWLTGRLWVAMLVHAGHNAVALSLLLWFPDAMGS